MIRCNDYHRNYNPMTVSLNYISIFTIDDKILLCRLEQEHYLWIILKRS